MIQKSYNSKKSNLYIVPTPIGNMDDITNRAIKILSSVDAIYAEDTRVTNILLNNLGIKNKVISCHKFSEAKMSNEIIEKLRNGENLALVTDRGTPLISDPGSLVAQNVIKENFNVIAIPGACAFVPALNMSGLPQDKFIFYGFLNAKDSTIKNELLKIKSWGLTTVLYEAPHRLINTLKLILDVLGDIEISIAREISKLHEEIYRGYVSEAISYYTDVKGEIVIVLKPNYEEINYDLLLNDVKELVDLGLKGADAVKYVAKKNNASKNILYNKYEESKK